MHHVIGTLLIGAVAGGVAGNRDKRRPLVRRLVKGGIVAKRKLQAAGATAIAQTRKLVEEARADLDQPRTEMHQ
jgi:hypothetical protein